MLLLLTYRPPLLHFLCFFFLPLRLNSVLFSPNFSLPSEFPAESALSSFSLGSDRSFVQEEEHSPAWSVSYKAPNDGSKNVRTFDRYIFKGIQFAKPPDPQSVWQEQLNQLKRKEETQNLELLGKAEIPQALRNYFSLDLPPDKVIKEFTGVDLHSLLGPHFDKFIDTTIAPTFTRPTTPKDKLVQYFERSLDNFLDGRYRAMERIPYLMEKEKQTQKQKTKTKDSERPWPIAADNKKGENEEFTEGSGEEPDELGGTSSSSLPSSISGIPKQIPLIPKVPVDFVVPQEDQPTEIVSKLLEMNAKKVEKEIDQMTKTLKSVGSRPKAKGAVLYEKSVTEGDGAKAKPIKQHFEYGDKPSYQQGVVSSLLQFLGINNPQESTELDQVLTEWIMDHSPRHVTKQERKSNGGESSYTRLQRFLSSPLTPLCSVGTETMQNFELDSLMGQWFEVMHSPLLSSSVCTMFSYEMLSRSSSPEGVGSVFQTLQFSSQKGNRTTNPSDEFRRWGESIGTMSTPIQQQPLLSSGYAIVPRPGQIVFRRSNSPEEVNVRVIDAAYGDTNDKTNGKTNANLAIGGVRRRYEYAILGINCNYPLFVIAREPYTFKQKYERRVMDTLEKKGLINRFSRLLSIVTGVDPAQCQLPAHLFDAKAHF